MWVELVSWHWLSFAGVLLIGEMLGAAGFLLGLAAASLIIAILLALGVQFDWQQQLALFSVLSVICSFAYFKVFKRADRASQAPMLNNRAGQLVGRSIVLTDTLVAGEGKIFIGDTHWRVKANQTLVAGTIVEVIGYEGMTLVICERGGSKR